MFIYTMRFELKINPPFLTHMDIYELYRADGTRLSFSFLSLCIHESTHSFHYILLCMERD